MHRLRGIAHDANKCTSSIIFMFLIKLHTFRLIHVWSPMSISMTDDVCKLRNAISIDHTSISKNRTSWTLLLLLRWHQRQTLDVVYAFKAVQWSFRPNDISLIYACNRVIMCILKMKKKHFLLAIEHGLKQDFVTIQAWVFSNISLPLNN